MFPEQRYMKIVEMVSQKGMVTVAELSAALGVSSVTIRRDLEKLEENQQLLRTHGGAIPPAKNGVLVPGERTFTEKYEALSDEKERIAAAAAAMVEAGESVLLTPGTTSMSLAKKLIDKSGVTIVTNAANIAVYVSENSELDVIMLGGKMRSSSYALVGALTELTLRQIRVDKLFLGVDGFDLEQGLTTPSLSEASINKLMMEYAKETIVVADRTKFGKVTLSHIAPVSAITAVITDSMLDASYVQQLKEAGIQVVQV
ncbi:DeoR/GlpR family DNA-binding transcription regulator [Paenibacillus turpanensis]|uniref:DeoR/GlpR family DNA-binding transcription regulator n=1 Tax=Paenibacillus turpanensis TaxID=2689078 RepID=UPI001409ECA7|nr:DeoR/GlpR family DNA-binding transcription regulator [Paenibacillus turpanensis]